MKYSILSLLLLVSIKGWAQEKLLNQCFVFTIDSELKTDLRDATFDLPFAAMRASKTNEKKVVPHYLFDIQAVDNNKSKELRKGLLITSLRPYVYGETLAHNEIAFFAMEWPEKQRPEGSGSTLASFPSLNNNKVITDHLIINQRIELPKALVEQLGLKTTHLESGIYKLHKKDVVY